MPRLERRVAGSSAQTARFVEALLGRLNGCSVHQDHIVMPLHRANTNLSSYLKSRYDTLKTIEKSLLAEHVLGGPPRGFGQCLSIALSPSILETRFNQTLRNSR